MNWSDLIAHVRERHVVSRAEGESIELWWHFSNGAMSIRQHQSVSRSGSRYVVTAEVAVPRRAWAALRAGGTRYGTLVEHPDRLELRTYLTIEGLGRPLLDFALHGVAQEAARLSMELARRQHATVAQSHAHP